MRGRLGLHIRRNVVNYAAAFLALSGTAYALDGPLPDVNQVGSDDIIDGEVLIPDIPADAVRSGEIVNSGVRQVDLAAGTLTGADVAAESVDGTRVANLAGADIDESTLFNNGQLQGDSIADTNTLTTAEINDASLFNDDSLTGAEVSNLSTLGGLEINEAGLTGVNAATVDGIDADSYAIGRTDTADSGQCTGSLPDDTAEVCADVSLTLPRSARAMVVASGAWEKGQGQSAASVCFIHTTAEGFAASTQIGESGDSHDVEDGQIPFGLNTLSNIAPSVTQTYSLRCRDDSTGSTDVDDAVISVFTLGTG